MHTVCDRPYEEARVCGWRRPRASAFRIRRRLRTGPDSCVLEERNYWFAGTRHPARSLLVHVLHIAIVVLMDPMVGQDTRTPALVVGRGDGGPSRRGERGGPDVQVQPTIVVPTTLQPPPPCSSSAHGPQENMDAIIAVDASSPLLVARAPTAAGLTDESSVSKPQCGPRRLLKVCLSRWWLFKYSGLFC